MELAILFGGASFEHEISIVSAITVKSKLNKYTLSFIFCDADHEFYKIDASNMRAKYFSNLEYKKSSKLSLIKGGFEEKKMFASKTLKVNVLNLIHGADGEDGSISALFDFYNIPFIGPRKEASVFSFDKEYTKYIARSLDVRTLDYEVVHANQAYNIKTPLPYIIKPARLGSSIGVSVVKDESEVDYALDVAFEYDTRVIIEPFIDGVKEYNLAGYGARESIRYSIIEEPAKNEFLDFDKKYLDFSRSATVSEADIDEKLKLKMQSTFSKLYGELFRGALIRCDFFVINDEVYLNEINPIPGSMASYLFEDFEVAVGEILEYLPKNESIKVDYNYINSINQAKGK